MPVKLSNSQQDERIKRAVIELYELDSKYKKIKKQYEDKKKKLTTVVKNFIFCNKGMQEFQFLAQSGDMFAKDNKMLGVKKISPVSVVWDADALEKALDKELAAEVIDKEYMVLDMPGLIKYLKSCGVNPKKFKSFIHVKKTVNKDALEQLSEIGEIDEAMVKGCYTVAEKESYLKIGIIKDE